MPKKAPPRSSDQPPQPPAASALRSFRSVTFATCFSGPHSIASEENILSRPCTTPSIQPHRPQLPPLGDHIFIKMVRPASGRGGETDRRPVTDGAFLGSRKLVRLQASPRARPTSNSVQLTPAAQLSLPQELGLRWHRFRRSLWL